MSLGLGDIIPTSPVQSRGLIELSNMITRELRALGFDTRADAEPVDPDILKLAIIGRPNVGKSSLVNAISGEMRSIVKDMPGTTRDSIDTIILHTPTSTTPDSRLDLTPREICLIDTAGIRRAGKIGSANIEQWSVLRAERSIERADIIAVVMDAYE